MARLRLLTLLLVFATFALVASGAPAVLGSLLGGVVGAVGTVVGTVTGVVSGTVNTTLYAVNATLGNLVKPVTLLSDTRSIVIVLKDDDIQHVIDQAADKTPGEWTEQQRIDNIQRIVDALQAYAELKQGPVIELLETVLGLIFKPYWIANIVTVLDCPLAIVQALLQLPIVEEIIYDAYFILDPVEPTADSTSNTATAGWGATKIKASDVWATSITGQNVVVGTIDSGVRHTHETLANNWVGAYGWYDPENKVATPYDANGHGTHTMATIAGRLGVGIAPGVKWMTCRGCGATACTMTLLLQCGQFMLCPTDTNGNNCNPAKAPHIVSNSWGAGQGMSYFQSIIDAWSAARIIPVFAAGNNGASGCSTVVTPGDSAKVFSVGSSDSNDALASTSSRGPSVNGLVKPDFTGPGVSVRSAWNGNNADYRSVSGTSMAAPHVAGTIALALSARPGLSFANLKTILTGSADRSTLPATAQTCGGTSSSTFPNNQYGNGRINAQKAVNAAKVF